MDFEDESQRAVTHILFFEIRFPRLSGNGDKEVLNLTGLDMLLVKILNFFKLHVGLPELEFEDKYNPFSIISLAELFYSLVVDVIFLRSKHIK